MTNLEIINLKQKIGIYIIDASIYVFKQTHQLHPSIRLCRRSVQFAVESLFHELSHNSYSENNYIKLIFIEEKSTINILINKSLIN